MEKAYVQNHLFLYIPILWLLLEVFCEYLCIFVLVSVTVNLKIENCLSVCQKSFFFFFW